MSQVATPYDARCGSHLAAQAREPYRAFEALFDRRDRLAVEINETIGNQFQPDPADARSQAEFIALHSEACVEPR